jgi:cob(I)alamin adenosyltransferase
MVTPIKKKLVLKGDDDKEHLGMVHVITGDGKGKTTSALGLAMRALGANLQVYMIQFLKSGITGELHIIKKKLSGMQIIQFGVDAVKERQKKLDTFTDKSSTFVFNPDEVEREAAMLGFMHAKKVIESKEHHVVILDEMNVVLNKDLVPMDMVLDMIKNRENTELVFTGRDAPEELKAVADYVNVVQRIKHPWQKGIKARKGIEY